MTMRSFQDVLLFPLAAVLIFSRFVIDRMHGPLSCSTRLPPRGLGLGSRSALPLLSLRPWAGTQGFGTVPIRWIFNFARIVT